MPTSTGTTPAEVFVSYASHDVELVVPIVEQLEAAGVTVWRDQHDILGGGSYGPEIVRAIRSCKVLTLMCSAASMRSANVKQEIQLAWKYGRPYLPLLLDQTVIHGFPEQVEYWLEGCQWIELFDRPAQQWLPRELQSIERIGAGVGTPEDAPAAAPTLPALVRPHEGLGGLWRLGSFTDQIWPVPAEAVQRCMTRGAMRGLGAPQPHVQHGFPLGSRVRLEIEMDRPGHLLLLDSGPEGITYCLCPSAFAPQSRLEAGRHVLPQREAQDKYDSFVVTGQPGREQLLAILTDEPLGLDWMTDDPMNQPARVLSPNDIHELLDRLHRLEADRWTALATYFDINS
jgi:hypothetical protein